jgi:pyruvate/2-oxoglutarate dehydrogenase complex dihydrolipoamide dehydrogenase (E3) component
MGLGLAEWLAERGKTVDVLERTRVLGADVEDATLPVFMERLAGNPRITMRTDREVREIYDGATPVSSTGASAPICNVIIAQSGTIGPLFAETLPDVDLIIFAEERRSNNELAVLARSHQLAPEIYEIGDCYQPRSALEAVFEGASIARRV